MSLVFFFSERFADKEKNFTHTYICSTTVTSEMVAHNHTEEDRGRGNTIQENSGNAVIP